MSVMHWVIVLVAVVVVFGTKKLAGAGKDLGKAVRGFKEGMGLEKDDAKEGGSPRP